MATRKYVLNRSKAPLNTGRLKVCRLNNSASVVFKLANNFGEEPASGCCLGRIFIPRWETYATPAAFVGRVTAMNRQHAHFSDLGLINREPLFRIPRSRGARWRPSAGGGSRGSPLADTQTLEQTRGAFLYCATPSPQRCAPSIYGGLGLRNTRASPPLAESRKNRVSERAVRIRSQGIAHK